MNSDASLKMELLNASCIGGYNLSDCDFWNLLLQLNKKNLTDCDFRNLSLQFNESNFTDCDFRKPRREVPSYHFTSQVTATVFFVVIFLIGVFGNLLVIMVVCLNRNMKTSVNIYLINLCIADILVLTVCMPTVLVDVYARDIWYFGKLMCSLVPFLENTVVHASVMTLIAISVERYRVVCRPLRGIKDNFYKHIKIIPVIWLICGLSNIPWFYIAVYKDSKHFDNTPIKVCRLTMFTGWRTTYVTLLCIFYFLIPFIILLILYSRICYILHKTKDMVSVDVVKDTSHSRQRRRLRAQVVNIISSLIVVFFVFHVPYRAVSLWFTFADKYQIYNLGIHKYFNIVYSVRILFYFNHAINPIVYNFVSSKFRTALLSLITKRKNQGSIFLSSNRRGKYHTPYTRPKNSQVILMGKDDENNDIPARGYSSMSSSSRQKINEFFPMYAIILQKQDSGRSLNEPSSEKLIRN